MHKSAIKVSVAHFKNLALKEGKIENAKIIIWVSPEQRYYNDSDVIKAMVDLVNKVFNAETCSSEIVVAGYLQRFNRYERVFSTVSDAENRHASVEALQLGQDWWKGNKVHFRYLSMGRNKSWWETWLNRPQYATKKKEIDELYGKDSNAPNSAAGGAGKKQYSSNYRDSVNKTSNMFVNANGKKISDAEKKEIALANRQEYLREESAFIKLLPKWALDEEKKNHNKIDKVYIVYPSGASPAMEHIIEAANKEKVAEEKEITWFTVQIKSREFAVSELLEKEVKKCKYAGFSSEIDKLSQTYSKGGSVNPSQVFVIGERDRRNTAASGDVIKNCLIDVAQLYRRLSAFAEQQSGNQNNGSSAQKLHTSLQAVGMFPLGNNSSSSSSTTSPDHSTHTSVVDSQDITPTSSSVLNSLVMEEDEDVGCGDTSSSKNAATSTT